MIFIGGKSYELVHDHKDGWNQESFKSRYSEVLDRYDYIIGDWGYSQLRLKGFFRDNHPKATKDSSYSAIMEYLNEYCNFGCAFFLLEKTSVSQPEPILPLEDISLAEAIGEAIAEQSLREEEPIPPRREHRSSEHRSNRERDRKRETTAVVSSAHPKEGKEAVISTAGKDNSSKGAQGSRKQGSDRSNSDRKRDNGRRHNHSTGDRKDKEQGIGSHRKEAAASAERREQGEPSLSQGRRRSSSHGNKHHQQSSGEKPVSIETSGSPLRNPNSSPE